MFSFFRRKPRADNLPFQYLSVMLWQEDQDPTFKKEFLNPEQLDFTMESLKHIDQYLEAIHSDTPPDEEVIKIALRTGAYVGEVIRKNSEEDYNWLEYKEALKANDLLKQYGLQTGTAAVLWSEPDNVIFPIAKILKYIENGNGDSVYLFAKVACEGFPAQ